MGGVMVKLEASQQGQSHVSVVHQETVQSVVAVIAISSLCVRERDSHSQLPHGLDLPEF